MQRNYNDRNDVRKLHPLGVGDRVRIKTDKEKYWSDSSVVKSADYNARSYIVQTPHGLLRRNRRHIQHTGDDRPLFAHSDIPFIRMMLLKMIVHRHLVLRMCRRCRSR